VRLPDAANRLLQSEDFPTARSLAVVPVQSSDSIARRSALGSSMSFVRTIGFCLRVIICVLLSLAKFRRLVVLTGGREASTPTQRSDNFAGLIGLAGAELRGHDAQLMGGLIDERAQNNRVAFALQFDSPLG
jgi:hypothetical protein